VDLFERLGSTIAGAATADEPLAEDEEIALAVANGGILAGLKVQGDIDQVIRSLGSGFVCTDFPEVDVLFDIDLVRRVDPNQIR